MEVLATPLYNRKIVNVFHEINKMKVSSKVNETFQKIRILDAVREVPSSHDIYLASSLLPHLQSPNSSS